MLLDFRKIFATCDAPIVRRLSLELSGEDFPGYTVKDPVAMEYTVQPEGSAVKLVVHVTATVLAECARCLDPIEREFSVEHTYLIREDEWCDEEKESNDLPFAQDGKLDMKELAYSELLLEIPTVLLCSDTCEGLCLVCGHRKPCSCKCETSDVPIDERLLILKQLLTD